MFEEIQKHRGFYLFESILMILLGILAIAIPGLFSLSAELLVGFLLLIGGGVQMFRSFKAKKAPGFLFSFVGGLISAFIGALLLAYPLTGVVALTIILAIFFFLEGIIQIALAFEIKPLKNWGWLLFSGIVSLILAVIIWSELPGSALWVIGLLLGINLLFTGFSQLFIVLGSDQSR